MTTGRPSLFSTAREQDISRIDWSKLIVYRGHYDMIYKAGPLRIHRVGIDAAPATFVATNSFRYDPSTFRDLSYINENQSRTNFFMPDNQTSHDHNARFYGEQSSMSFATYGRPREVLADPASSPASPNHVYNVSHTQWSAPSEHYEAGPETNSVVPSRRAYDSFTSETPSSSSNFHPPMLVPAQYWSSPPPTSPTSSTSPGPSPRKQELQIRMSQPCYEMGQRHHEILPLESFPFKK
jgi:hypothetical protein